MVGSVPLTLIIVLFRRVRGCIFGAMGFILLYSYK